MSLAVEGFNSSKLFDEIADGISKMSDDEKKANMKKVNGIFQMNVKNSGGKEESWTIDLKKEGKVYKGAAKPKADVTINLADQTFQDLADGKLNGQKAFMSGKLKVKGNIMACSSPSRAGSLLTCQTVTARYQARQRAQVCTRLKGIRRDRVIEHRFICFSSYHRHPLHLSHLITGMFALAALTIVSAELTKTPTTHRNVARDNPFDWLTGGGIKKEIDHFFGSGDGDKGGQTSACAPRMVVIVRGTTEAYGTCKACDPAVAIAQQKYPDIKRVDVEYAAGLMQDSSEGTANIISIVKGCPNSNIVLVGYSQGAAATTRAMSSLTPSAKLGALLFGSPCEGRGDKGAEDGNGGRTLATGPEDMTGCSVPSSWNNVDTLLELCEGGDPVCGSGMNVMAHIEYQKGSTPQIAANFIEKRLATAQQDGNSPVPIGQDYPPSKSWIWQCAFNWIQPKHQWSLTWDMEVIDGTYLCPSRVDPPSIYCQANVLRLADEKGQDSMQWLLGDGRQYEFAFRMWWNVEQWPYNITLFRLDDIIAPHIRHSSVKSLQYYTIECDGRPVPKKPYFDE
ncbi:carbohydrate esterase family 5 protein [Mixia osmundae IAM 14324]|uniref:SCP2 domain-containing protein n=1 Tax=Mixia osmundae (strain CBS 9802 / IAM 14324 / JCM 22182 / KY 12970) TaxID=764103 RepID=G7DY75_MIXOS|nr:carbohydrate esterase family 5 protein [Mixia osmundae IAM 14324]KEI41438.1 carbohydrate esterase family 5 protein [Mixia osmundae IAM 14324]GAA95535.1 hypothetical protein E5Q_02190 [Mixia osmundae IAM 14324]